MQRTCALVLVAACGGGGETTRVDSGPCVDAHDEDADGFGDACDICPATLDPRQLDTTELATMIAFADGVGDACDPRPALAGDKLGALHTFADAASADAWLGTGWTVAGDAAHASDAARWNAKTREMGDGLFVQAKLAQLAWLPAGTFEIVVDGDGIETGLVCMLARDRDGDGNDELEAREFGGSTMTKNATMPITGAVAMTAWRTIDVQRRGTLHCRATFEGGNVQLDVPTTDDAAVGSYGIAQQAATTEVSSIVVYTSPLLPVGNN